MQKVTCLVTIHGMGFQQAPASGAPGYADELHDHLKQHLKAMLGGDPVSEFDRPKGTGAIYVHSHWPVNTMQVEEGLHRLGTWKSEERTEGEVDTSQAPIIDGDAAISHVALVYSHLEDQGPHIGASFETAAKALVSYRHYSTLLNVVHMGIVDIWSALKHHQQGNNDATPSLRVRADAETRVGHPGTGSPSGLAAVLQQLDHDVATYVCRNDLRARVHDFVQEALLRICSRDDVEYVVINSHSLGTVVAFDAIRRLPPFAADKLRYLVTAGSPLRKYAELFYWGGDAGCLATVPWRNFWDVTDPVADPLVPPAEWRRGGSPVTNPKHPKLFFAYDPDTGKELEIDLIDFQVSNAAHGAGGGLPAHNYWDNDDEFVRRLDDILTQTVAGSPHSTAVTA